MLPDVVSSSLISSHGTVGGGYPGAKARPGTPGEDWSPDYLDSEGWATRCSGGKQGLFFL